MLWGAGPSRGGFQARGRGGGGQGWGRGGPHDGFQQSPGPAVGSKRPAEAVAGGEEAAKRGRVGDGGVASAEASGLANLQGYGSSEDEGGKQSLQSVRVRVWGHERRCF